MQANVAARYEWGMSSGLQGHLQGQVVASDKSYSDIIEPNKAKQDSYSYANIRAGISNDSRIITDACPYVCITITILFSFVRFNNI